LWRPVVTPVDHDVEHPDVAGFLGQVEALFAVRSTSAAARSSVTSSSIQTVPLDWSAGSTARPRQPAPEQASVLAHETAAPGDGFSPFQSCS
jgi:hypothetical protein